VTWLEDFLTSNDLAALLRWRRHCSQIQLGGRERRLHPPDTFYKILFIIQANDCGFIVCHLYRMCLASCDALQTFRWPPAKWRAGRPI